MGGGGRGKDEFTLYQERDFACEIYGLIFERLLLFDIAQKQVHSVNSFNSLTVLGAVVLFK